jgi:predicted component of type VI protein secretion system
VQARLVVIAGEPDTATYDLQLPAIVGRSRSADVTLVHSLVSRQHCELFESNEMLMVRDLGSRNGTFVGDLRIAEEPMPIKPGDVLTVGGVTLRAEYAASSSPANGAQSPGQTVRRQRVSTDEDPDLTVREGDPPN